MDRPPRIDRNRASGARTTAGEMPGMDRKEITRTEFLKGAVLGAVGVALPGAALAAQGTDAPKAPELPGTLSDELIAGAEPLVGVAYPPDKRKPVAASVKGARKSLDALRALPIENAIAPAVIFRPEGRQPAPGTKIDVRASRVSNLLPALEDDVAFLSVVELGAILRAGRISSVELTKFFLRRLETYGPRLNAVITMTPE
ncbi:hypothetical protein EON81_23480, partial [bacterium]